MGRTALVMSGGGAKGAFELGAADCLIRDNGIDPDVLVGVSTGNLNAAMLAQGKGHAGLLEKLDQLRSLWFGLARNSDIYTKRFLGLLGLFAKADSIYSNEPLWRLIQEHVNPADLAASGRLLRIGVVGLKSGKYRVVCEHDSRILDMIRASTAIPVFFNPVDIDGERLVDGGVRNVTPLSTAFDALAELDSKLPIDDGSPDTIYILLASPLDVPAVTSEDELDSGIEIGMRSLELLVNEVYENDLKLAVTVNQSLCYFEKVKASGAAMPEGFPYEGYRYVNLVAIQPKRLYMDGLEFDHAQIRAAFEAGREAAAQALQQAAQKGGSNI